jgi:hypothetical protein
LTQQMKRELTRRIVFCVSSDLDESLRDMAWEERKPLSQLIREFCECGLAQMRSASS